MKSIINKTREIFISKINTEIELINSCIETLASEFNYDKVYKDLLICKMYELNLAILNLKKELVYAIFGDNKKNSEARK
jgi:hypothetical protein